MGEKVSSSLNYVNEMMDHLQGKITDTSAFTEGKHDVESVDKASQLYAKTNQIMKAYTAAHEELMKKLNHEANSIRLVAQQYYALDQQLQEGAEQL